MASEKLDDAVVWTGTLVFEGRTVRLVLHGSREGVWARIQAHLEKCNPHAGVAITLMKFSSFTPKDDDLVQWHDGVFRSR